MEITLNTQSFAVGSGLVSKLSPSTKGPNPVLLCLIRQWRAVFQFANEDQRRIVPVVHSRSCLKRNCRCGDSPGHLGLGCANSKVRISGHPKIPRWSLQISSPHQTYCQNIFMHYVYMRFKMSAVTGSHCKVKALRDFKLMNKTRWLLLSECDSALESFAERQVSRFILQNVPLFVSLVLLSFRAERVKRCSKMVDAFTEHTRKMWRWKKVKSAALTPLRTDPLVGKPPNHPSVLSLLKQLDFHGPERNILQAKVTVFLV